MLRVAAATIAMAVCARRMRSIWFAVRPSADRGRQCRQTNDQLGSLQSARESDTTPPKRVRLVPGQTPPGAPVGFHGCEMEVTVDARTQHVLGYSLSNIGWAKCPEVQRKIHVAER
jgi:hypothetical protein